VLPAVGQSTDLGFLDGSGIAIQRGLVMADPLSLETTLEGVFACGDVVHGPRTVVAAIRAGKQAAASIAAFLDHRPTPADWEQFPRRTRVSPLTAPATSRLRRPRAVMPEIPIQGRDGYQALELGLSDDAATAEASRCLRCDLCHGCGLCELVCSEMGAEALRMIPSSQPGRLIFSDFTRPADMCLGCGTCAAICPTNAIRMEDEGDMRATIITGTVVARRKLEICPNCGSAIATSRLLAKTGKARLCPDCARQSRAGGFAGRA
jgi:Pyruvate/2-oxoacid:ferredoxin oxidoreductase delta subunit